MIARNGTGLNHGDGETRKIENSTPRSFSPPPAQTPASKRKARLEAAIGVLLALRQRWPDTFPRLSARTRRPLKIGIRDDVIAALPDIPPAQISLALGIYVNSAPYLYVCTEGEGRIDLNGQSVGVVSADEALHARAKLEKHHRRDKPKASSPAPETPRRITLNDLRAAAARKKGAAP